ncbi:LIC_13387 family protein [Streptomyces roseolilacinus]|uniref:LIC_13387 family protein n=1 Tax=Streptomyces roseolilacinus TaxID=66904 RepID=UPI003803A602
MNTAATSRPLSRADSVRPFTVGAYGFVFLGVGHLALSTVEALAARTPERRELDAAMRESTFALLGLERTVLDVFNGMSIAMAFFSVTCGLLILAAVRHAPVLVQRRTAFGWTALAVSLAVLAVSVLLLPPPPIIVLTVTSCAFALSLRRAATPSAREAAVA